MDTKTLDALGFTNKELQDRVVDQIVAKLSDGHDENEYVEAEFLTKVRDAVAERIDAAIERVAESYVAPKIADHIETMALQRTNEWGEKKGKRVTFTEYMVQKAEDYMTEKVNADGKSKNEERDSSYWRGTQTRIVHLIGAHLHHRIEASMKEALSHANNSIAKGIEGAVKIKLDEIVKTLSVGIVKGR